MLDLASYFIVNEENVSQYYPDYAFSHPLFTKGMRIYSDSTISRFLSSVSKEQIINFLDDWNKGKDRNQMVYVSYDSTNKNCQAGDVELVEFGKAKDEKGFPVFNLSIAFDQTNRVPLFYEEYPGSITDVSQFTHMADKVIEYGYKKIGFILDRGYFSKYNIQYMDNSGFSFLLMVKGCKALVSKLVEENRNTFESKRDCSIRLYKVYGTTVKSKLYDDDSKERYFHVYFSAEKQAFEREQLEIKLEEFEQFLKNHIGKDTKFGQTYKQFFDLSYDNQGKLRKVEERADEIQKALNLCGYFCLVSSEEMSAKEAIILYKGRDATEKLFAIDKTFLGSKSMRVHSSQAVSAKIFIEFIALIIRNRIYILLNEELSKLTKKPNYMNVPAALKELEKIEMVRGSKDLYQLSYAVSKRQKTILNAFDIDADKVRLKAAQINKKLQKKF
ncbi:MAG: IS1634 family transposase [Bdellovibrionota bacterium]